MSVGYYLVRVTPLELKRLQDQPDSIGDFIEDLDDRYATPDGMPKARVQRELYIDEFTVSLISRPFWYDTPLELLNRAIVDGSQILEGAVYGMGAVLFHAADEVQAIAEELGRFPLEVLRAHFQDHADHLRPSGSEFHKTDEAILEYQKARFSELVAFYQAAAREGNAVLISTA